MYIEYGALKLKLEENEVWTIIWALHYELKNKIKEPHWKQYALDFWEHHATQKKMFQYLCNTIGRRDVSEALIKEVEATRQKYIAEEEEAQHDSKAAIQTQ